MAWDANEWLFEQACELAIDRESSVLIRDRNGKRETVELYTAGLRYDACAYISYDEYILIIDLLDGGQIIYDGYHHCFREHVPGERIVIDEERESPIFSVNLFRMMRERDVDAEELASAVRLSTKMIHRYLNGECLPNYDRLVRICGALRCFVTDLTLKH